ncbi:MAG: BatA and WFA domain-containing protein [Phycisphaerales bacterium]|nr:BatA and WFA domain-containing protein [Phycisphaerales bacterium]
MTWVTPLIAGIAAAVAIPSLIILYFLKLRRRDVEISSTLLWRKAIEDLQANAPFQKLRRNILLLLQLLILAGILLAVGQPELKGSSKSGEKHIIIIDRSASMEAMDVDGSRLDEARRQAREIVEGLREGGPFQGARSDEAMVIAFDTFGEVVQQFTTDKGLLNAAIDRITASAASSKLTEAMQLAKAHMPRRIVEDQIIDELTAGVPAIMHLVSDGRIVDLEEVSAGVENTLEYHPIGTPEARNIAITGLQAERAYDNPVNLSIFVGVQSTDPTTRNVDVELYLDGNLVRTTGVTLSGAAVAPDGSIEPSTNGVNFRLEEPSGVGVYVKLATRPDPDDVTTDVLRADDEGWLIVPPARQSSVAVITQGNPFLTEALRGLPLAKLDIYDEEAGARFLRTEDAATYDVIILDRWTPSETLDPGRWLIFGATPAGLDRKGETAPATIITSDGDHPVTRGLNFDNLLIAEQPAIDASDDLGVDVLVESSNGPSIVELSSAEVRAVVVTFSILESNWPFELSYVLFLAQAVDYLAKDGVIGAESRQFRPGDLLSDRLPRGAENVRVRQPDGSETALVAGADGRVVFGPVRQTGIYELTWTGPAGLTDVDEGGRVRRVFASNMLDPRESTVNSRKEIATASSVVAASSTSGLVNRKLWPWFVLAALAIVMLEWWVYNRKVHV